MSLLVITSVVVDSLLCFEVYFRLPTHYSLNRLVSPWDPRISLPVVSPLPVKQGGPGTFQGVRDSLMSLV